MTSWSDRLRVSSSTAGSGAATRMADRPSMFGRTPLRLLAQKAVITTSPGVAHSAHSAGLDSSQHQEGALARRRTSIGGRAVDRAVHPHGQPLVSGVPALPAATGRSRAGHGRRSGQISPSGDGDVPILGSTEGGGGYGGGLGGGEGAHEYSGSHRFDLRPLRRLRRLPAGGDMRSRGAFEQ